MECIIAIGIPGCGKSTYGHNLLNTVVISSDSIREELYGDENIQGDANKVFSIMFDRTVETLKSGKRAFYDATNLSRKRRINLIKEIERKVPDTIFTAVVFAIPFTVCCARNEARERTVPRNVMERMYKSFQPPHWNEGFTNIETVLYASDPLDRYSAVLSDCNIPHDNHHHELNIIDHMNAAYQYAEDNDFSSIVCVAAQFHDIGKPFCKTFTNRAGEETEEAHYYAHENVGAYMWLCLTNGKDAKSIMIIANLIHDHMKRYDPNFLEKAEKFYDKEYIDMLEQLYLCDINAH